MKLIYEDLTYQLRGICYQTYNALGPGFDEKLYQKICFSKCISAGLEAKKEEEIHVRYKGYEIATLFIDLLVEDKVIVEFKVVDAIAPVHKAQISCYLRATAMTIGLLVNFNLSGVKIERLANFPQPVEKVRIQDYFSKDSDGDLDVSDGVGADSKFTDSSDEVVLQVIGGICELWNELSYGYLEPIYYRALETELGLERLFFDKDFEFDVFFDGKRIGTQKIKSVLNDEVWVVLTSATKPRKGLERKIRSILNQTPLKCAILASLSGKRPKIQVIQSETG